MTNTKRKASVAKVITKKSTKTTKNSNKKNTILNKTIKNSKDISSKNTNKETLKNLDKPFTRTQQITHLADTTNLSKKDITNVMGSLEQMISSHLKQLGEISVGGLMKLTITKRPATKAKEGINPFTGQPTIFKAKPAKKVVKIRALKKMKDMVM